MSSSKSSSDDGVVKAFKPTVLLEGISVEHIKSLPKVRELLENIIDAEKKIAYKIGFEKGAKEGKELAYKESKVDYDRDLLKHFETNTDALSEMVVFLKKPIKELREDVIKSLKTKFDDVLSAIVLDANVYDEKVSTTLASLVKDLPENNRLIKVFIKNKLNKKFVEYFSGFDVEVESVEMDDLIRVETSCGDFRFSAIDYANTIINR